ncbi:MAG: VWA domain-containing protein [Planctomycetes bacterium]|nr:VWA domain-containing protein [Planctomycetota bacterium]
MFLDFFYTLRRHGVRVSPTEWLALQDALSRGLGTASLAHFYQLTRALLVKSEALFDHFDLAFAEHFEGVEAPAEIKEQFWEWLQDPANLIRLLDLDHERLRRLFPDQVDFDRLRELFEKRLKEQTERHDGGDRWVGTRGRSPFGAYGEHPAGIRVGGQSMSRSAVKVAAERRFRNYRADITLDTRQIRLALRALRNLAREGEEELDLPGTIDGTCRNGGEIDIRFERSRRNTVKLLLLMDAGGSMTPHTRLVSLLFSAAHSSRHFKSFQHFYFHNCVYDHVYPDIERGQRVRTADLLRNNDRDVKLALVGDACMAHTELTSPGGAIDYWENNRTPGIEWLKRLRRHFECAAWINPDPARYWDHYTVAAIGNVFPMFELTLEGIDAAVRALKARPQHPAGLPGAAR